MAYFTDYPTIKYPFTTNSTATNFTDIGAYVDLLDRAKDDISFYKEYYIRDGDRPDQVSYTLYDNADYYWTFFALNDEMKRRGWPLSNKELTEKAQREYPNTTLTTRANLATQFLEGSIVTGTTSGATGIVLRRRPDLGQIIVNQTNTFNFVNSETITTTEADVPKSAIIDRVSEEYNAKHHYEDVNGRYVDISPNAPFIQRLSLDIRWTGNYAAWAGEAFSPLSTQVTADKFIIDDVGVSNLSGIYNNFSLDEITVQAVFGNIIPGGTALLIGAALQQQFVSDDEYTVDDFQTNYLINTLQYPSELAVALTSQLQAILVGIAASGGTPPTNLKYHIFTLVDNQLNVAGLTDPIPQYFIFEFRSNVSVDMTTVYGGIYEPLAFDTITANDAANAEERNFVAYSATAGIGAVVSDSPFLENATGSETIDTNNEAFNFVQNEIESYIATSYDDLIPATITPVTFLERYQAENEELRSVKVLRPTVVEEFDRQTRRILQESPNADIATAVGVAQGSSTFTSNPTVGSATPTTTTTSAAASSSGGSSY